jgi:hypothetical protein
MGEYKYSEAPIEEETEESSHRVEMTDQIKSKYEEEIYELVQNCIENKSEVDPLPDVPEESKFPHEEYVQKMDNFNILMGERTARTVFLDSLSNYNLKKETKLQSWDSFNQLSEMVLICLNKIDHDDDRENALRLIELCNNFYIELEKTVNDFNLSTPEKMLYKNYLTKSIENHRLIRDSNFWEKLIFESIRKELRNEFFEYQYEIDTENAYKEIIYYKLMHIISTMLIFKIDKKEIKDLIVNFCDSHDLWEEQRINLISKIANYESAEERLQREQELKKRQEEYKEEYSPNGHK